MLSEEKFEEIIRLAAKDAEKASETVAKVFYRILRKNGFTNEQIVSVAGNILDCLCNTYEEYSSRPKKRNIKTGGKQINEG